MEFLKDNSQEEIVSALMSGQSKVTIGNVEFKLKPLKRDTTKNREREAVKIAKSLSKLL
tara:strand:- start:10208 stop:10384 length:177 start_codon:yes stop_codon:yes gene_type:complete